MARVDSTVRDLDDMIEASRAVKRRFEADAYLNAAFYTGQQWVAYDGTRLWEPQLEDWREKVTDNRIQPIVRTEIAKMTKTRPTFTCLPRSGADQDIADARYGETVLEDAWERHVLSHKLRQALLWARVSMAGFWKVWWDSGVGPTREFIVYNKDHPQAGRTVKDQYGAPISPDVADKMPADLADMVEQKSAAAGEVCVELRTFFQTFPDPHAGEDGLDAAEYIGEEAIYTRAYMKRRFPEAYEKLTFDAAPTAGAAEMRTALAMADDPRVPQSAKGIKVREVWTDDKHVIWIEGGTVLKEEDTPYPWLPYVMFRGVPVPGRFWPDSVVTQLRPRQVDLNKRLSQIAENAERIGNPPLLIPSSMAEDFTWQGLPGEVVVFQDSGSPNAAPAFMQVPEQPAYVREDVSRITDSLMEISGQHEVSGAQVPQGVTAASAINLLQEADDTRLGPDVLDMEMALAGAGKRILDLVDEYYDERRHINIAGEDGTWDVQEFKSGGLKGAKDVRVQAGSAMPQSKAAKQAAIQQIATLFVQNGIPITERQWHKILSQYEVGGLQQFFASQSRDERQVIEENRKLAAGVKLEINSYDDDQAHISGHTDWQKTAQYSELSARVKTQVEDHVKAHRVRLVQMAPPAPAANGSTPAPGGTPTMPPVA